MGQDLNDDEDMSEQSDQLSVEGMAIPEGGAQEQMDVSTDDSPGYVSIKTKGPGKPIIIRSDGSEQTLSQFVNSSLSVPTERKDDVYNKYAMDEEDGMVEEAEFYLDKKTGKTIILTKDTPEDERNIGDKECEVMQDFELSEKIIMSKSKSLLDDREEIQAKAQTEASFRSQAKVFSIGTNLQDDRPEILNSLSRKKYKLSQKGTKKNVGTKKNSPGKVESSLRLIQRPSPYPNWIMDLPIREVLDKAIVDEEGNMLQLELNLVPMKSGTEFKRVDTLQVQNVQNTGNDIFSGGSIDRPPDEVTCLNFHRNQTGAVSAVALTQPSATTYDNVGNNVGSHQFHDATMGTMSAPNIYGDVIDQPLDLTVEKPLDLSMKGKSENIPHLGDDRSVEEEVVEVDDEELSIIESGPTKTEVDTNMTEYRTRCPSVLSVSGKESIQGDETYDMITNHYPRETDKNNIGDGNLPSLSRLSLKSNSQAHSCTAVQDSNVKEAMVNIVESQQNTVSGQQNILNLLASNKVSLEQLLNLYVKNKMEKTASTSSGATGQALPINQRTNFNQVHGPQSQIAIRPADNEVQELDVPALAMPNLCSLELANTEGEILVTQKEQLKNKLKEKLLQGQNKSMYESN